MRTIIGLFIVLLLLLVFMEGIMIIDQERRIDKLSNQVEYRMGRTDALLDRAEMFFAPQVLSTSTLENVN